MLYLRWELPPGSGLQGQASNHPVLLRSKDVVVSDRGKQRSSIDDEVNLTVSGITRVAAIPRLTICLRLTSRKTTGRTLITAALHRPPNRANSSIDILRFDPSAARR